MDFIHDGSIESLSGYLIGQGIFNINRKRKKLDLIYSLLESDNPFIRRCSVFSYGLSFLGEDVDDLSVFEKALYDENLDIRKTSLVSLGLASLKKSDEKAKYLFDEGMKDKNWKIRSSAGIGFYLTFLGNDQYFDDVVFLLENEKSPYVKVSLSWYISLANASFEKYKELLRHKESFFRDMASLGLGYSFLGKRDEKVLKLLTEHITNDKHPYVRESSCFGLGLNYFQNPDIEFKKIISNAMKDNSPIVRGGAALSLGIANYKKQFDFSKLINKEKNNSVLWGLYLSQGLSNSKNPIKYKGSDYYVMWADELKDIFLDNVENKKSKFINISKFQEQINLGMINSCIEKQNIDPFKLIYPGISYYIVYDSFWWGLWVLSSLGTILWEDKK